jgi:hypothetical protein
MIACGETLQTAPGHDAQPGAGVRAERSAEGEARARRREGDARLEIGKRGGREWWGERAGIHTGEKRQRRWRCCDAR